MAICDKYQKVKQICNMTDTENVVHVETLQHSVEAIT